MRSSYFVTGARDLGGGGAGDAHLPPEMTCGFLIQLVFYQKTTLWFIGVEVKHEKRLKSYVKRRKIVVKMVVSY